MASTSTRYSANDDSVEKEDFVDHHSPDDEHHDHAANEGCSILPHGGIVGSGFNLASATLGAGTLALPAAMQGSGVLVGSFLLVLICGCTIFSITLLVRLFDKFHYKTYEEMSAKFLHPKMEKVTAFLIVAFCWGITIVYVVAMGDILSQVATVSWFPKFFKDPVGNQILVIVFWACAFLPLSLLKEINSLRYSSVVGICATIFLVTAIAVHDGESDDGTRQVKWAAFDIPMIASLPVFIFAYCCQTNAFEVYTELRPRTVKRMTLSAGLSMSICTMIYIVAGAAGEANFGKNVHGNILKNYNPSESIYIAIAYVAISFTLVSAFPLCIFPTRDAIVQVLGYKSAYHTPAPIRLVICATLAFLSLVAGLYAPGIQVLFGLLGGICGSSIGFIFPALFTLRSEGYSRQSAGTLEYICVWILLIIGVIAGVLGTILSIVQTAQG